MRGSEVFDVDVVPEARAIRRRVVGEYPERGATRAASQVEDR